MCSSIYVCPQARERAGLHLSTTTTTTIIGVGCMPATSVEQDVACFRLFFSFSFCFPSTTSESREGVAGVERRSGEARIVVVVVVAIDADRGSLPQRRDCAHHFVGIGRCGRRRKVSQVRNSTHQLCGCKIVRCAVDGNFRSASCQGFGLRPQTNPVASLNAFTPDTFWILQLIRDGLAIFW